MSDIEKETDDIQFIQAVDALEARKPEQEPVEPATMDTWRRRGPRRWLIAASFLFVGVMLVLPLGAVLANALKNGLAFYWEAITSSYALSALRVTLVAAVAAVLLTTVFGIMAAWLLTRYDFPGQHALSALIDVPFSVSPVIAGLAFVMTFGRMGWAAPIVDWINNLLGTDIQLVFSVPGVVLATVFVTLPYVSRELIPVLEASGRDEEEAAALMGASGWRIFHKITLPRIRWALVYGIILCAARALGEFGAVYALSRTRGVTFTLPLEIDALYMSGSADGVVRAFAVSSVLVILDIILLAARSIIEARESSKSRG